MTEVQAEGDVTKIVAHRGASYDAPENTLAAFRLAFEQGADAIEGDFRLTSDSNIVCVHDKDGKRTLGSKVSIAHSTLEQLRKLDAGSWKGSNWVGERIPTLDEVLDLLPESAFLFMEVKCGPEIIKPLTARLKARRVKPSQIVVISFNREVIRKFKEFNPDFIAYLLTSFRTKKEDGSLIPTAKELITVLKDIQADGLDCNADSRLDPSFAKTLRKAGYSLHVWTVNDEAKARRFIKDFGVESITTDRPEWLRNKLD